MIQVEKTTKLLLGENETLQVSELPQNLQSIVGIIDDWREREANLASELTMAKAGIEQYRAYLIQGIQQWKASLAPATPSETPQEVLPSADPQ
jgi:hypothetical protein